MLGFSDFEEQELGADQRADLVEHRAGEEDDPLLQQAGEDIVGALAPGGLLDHHRNQVVGIDFDGVAVLHRHTFKPGEHHK